jgi:hypothetical protein
LERKLDQLDNMIAEERLTELEAKIAGGHPRKRRRE